MGLVSVLFPNPAVKILEARLWEAAQKRYLQEHPSERSDDATTLMRKTKDAYKATIAENLKQAEHKIRAKWAQFKHDMTAELKRNLITLFRMSDVDWYAIEHAESGRPQVIAAPYQLLKHLATALLFQSLRKQIEFEELDDDTLQALATYAGDQKFRELLEEARGHYEPIEIGNAHEPFAVGEIRERDPYFLGEEQHHSIIDMVILVSAHAGVSGKAAPDPKKAVKRWFHQDRKNRTNDRRFTADGWEISFEQLKGWAIRA